MGEESRGALQLLAEIPAEGSAAGGFEGLDVRIGQAVHDAAVQADVAEGLGVVHETHVLKAAEGHAEDQLLHFLLGVAAFGEEAGLLLGDFPGPDAVLIELGEAVRDALEAGLALGVHLVQEGQQEHRLVGIAHVHVLGHLQEEVLAVGVGDELPAEGFGVFLRALAVEVFEAAVLADGDLHVGDVSLWALTERVSSSWDTMFFA